MGKVNVILSTEESVSIPRKGRRIPVSSERIQARIQRVTRGIFRILEARDKLRFDDMSEGVGLVGEGETFLYVNSALEVIFGVEKGGLVGRKVTDFMSEDIEKDNISLETNQRKSGKSNIYEMFIIRQNDGELRRIRVTADPYLDENNEFLSTMGRVEDVTQQYDDIREIVKKQHIEHIKNKIYETVHGSNQMNDFYEKLHALLKESNVFDVRELSIGLYDEGADEIVFEYVRDSIDAKLRVIPNASKSETISMRMIETKKPLLMNKKPNEENKRRLGKIPETFIGAPLMIGNRAIGVIMTQKYEEGSAYTESQLDYFVAIADTVALAIQEKKDELNRAQNARMLEEMNYIANAVGASMSLKNLCQEIHAIIKRLIPRDELSRNFYLAVLPVGIENETVTEKTPIHYAYYQDEVETIEDDEITESMGNGLTALLLKKGIPIHLNKDVVTTLVQSGELERVGPESYDWLGIPLKIDKQTIGAIVVQSYVDGIGYDKSHESILTFISKQIALAIERKRQEDILLHQRDQLVAKSAELSMSYESIRELADEQGIGHALVNDNEIIEYANGPFCELFGSSHTELIGKSILDFIPSDDDKELVTSSTERRKKGIKDSYDITIQDKQHIDKQVRISSTPRRTHDGTLIIEAFFQDVSRLKYLEKSQMMDPIFEVLNVGAAQKNLNTLFSKAKREEFRHKINVNPEYRGVTLGFADVDFLKYTNDINGHKEGNILLSEAVHALKTVTNRGSDGLYRWGGDEFLLVLDDCNTIDAYGAFRTRLKDAIQYANHNRITRYHNYIKKYIESKGKIPFMIFTPLSLSVGFDQAIQKDGILTSAYKQTSEDIGDMVNGVDAVMLREKYMARGKLAYDFGSYQVSGTFLLLALEKDAENIEVIKLLEEVRKLYKGIFCSEEDARNLSNRLCDFMSERMLQENAPETFELYKQAKVLYEANKELNSK